MDGGVVFLPTHGPRRPLSLNLFATASFNPLINPQLIFCELWLQLWGSELKQRETFIAGVNRICNGMCFLFVSDTGRNCLPLSLKQTRFSYDEFSLEEKIRRVIPTATARLDKGTSRDQLSTKTLHRVTWRARYATPSTINQRFDSAANFLARRYVMSPLSLLV